MAEEKLGEFQFPFLQPRKLIDCPTAGLLPRGSFDFDIRVYPEGGVTTALEVGITNRLMIGISFGGQNVIGEGSPDWNPDMEFAVKYRFLHESYFLPAFAMGYDGQGYGAYDDSLKRYTYKSKGFYAVISKSYLVGTAPFGLHGGINYSLEDKDDENVPIYVGCDLRINEGLGFVLEYDIATNDDYKGSQYGQGWGYLNFGIQWFFSKNLLLEVDLKNVFKNREDVSTIGREFRVVYFEFF
ncbi:MAG: hypothetical protein AMJ90_01970 [candidate division Zixibacteria bacterium SM23_73_2]|nr:MAG: hypothetical protein AMJ90_01970 [candidate division Zixibacteria bacterium SM23_73_2]